MTDEASTPNGNTFHALELLIAISLSFIMLLSLIAAFVKDQTALKRWLQQNEITVNAVAITECYLLLLWMCLGGKRSNLWNRLPPFCLFPKVWWVKWLVILGLIAGTLAGVFVKESISHDLLDPR